jgi:hypothetical protein
MKIAVTYVQPGAEGPTVEVDEVEATNARVEDDTLLLGNPSDIVAGFAPGWVKWRKVDESAG